MRRAPLLLLLAIAGAARLAGAVPPLPEPEIEGSCGGPFDDRAMRACVARVEPGATITDPIAGVRAVHLGNSTYLFVNVGGRWHFAYRENDAGYELIGTAPARVRQRAALRIDLAYHMVLDNHRVMFERIAVVCADDRPRCRTFVTACTVLDRGRTTEVFRLTLSEVPGDLAVVGDRRYAGELCAPR